MVTVQSMGGGIWDDLYFLFCIFLYCSFIFTMSMTRFYLKMGLFKIMQ